VTAQRCGIEILDDRPGTGAAIKRQRVYRLGRKLWLNQGVAIRWDRTWRFIDRAQLEDDGTTLLTDLRIDRENQFAGLFQGIEGMRIGGCRKLKKSPHPAYGEHGIPGKIPPQALIIAEIEFIGERNMGLPSHE
jgi:hypothetical protein